MNAAAHVVMSPAPSLEQQIESACRRFAPAWPLDRLIAVNPHWGRVHLPFERAGADIARQVGSTLWMPASYYLAAWRERRIGEQDLRDAVVEAGVDRALDVLVAALEEPAPQRDALPMPSDCLDSRRDLLHEPSWRDAITHQVSQHCAAYFDRDQSDWRDPSRSGLYGRWRDAVSSDRGIVQLMHAPEIRARAPGLPADPRECIAAAIERFAVAPGDIEDFMTVALGRIQGWAAWCAYQRWQAQLAGGGDDHLVELLAVRLGWECLLDDGRRDPGSTWSEWRQRWLGARSFHAQPADPTLAVWQRALEIAYQRRLVAQITAAPTTAPPQPCRVQAIFCIDVRSEVYRRALERVMPEAQTFGFAGFFGLPIAYAPLGARSARPQLPGLLAPAMTVTDHSDDPAADRLLATRRADRLASQLAWKDSERLPGAAFTLVETLGLGYLARLLRRTFPSARAPADPDHAALRSREARGLRPCIQFGGDARAQRVDLAARVLGAMSLTRDFARTVLLVGHGSQSANNPHAAGLDCGACGGHTGAVNARALAHMLNDPGVRADLASRGIDIPPTTHFLPGLHNTTTDDLELFDLDRAPAGQQEEMARLKQALADAGDVARQERAAALGLSRRARGPRALAQAVRRRANDWAETRPEWGLAGNAAFIAAPRFRTRGVDLEGRAFLHDYDWRADGDLGVLELILTAPVVVAHWINLQYYASTVDNRRFGSGNKVLHNAVGGRIGVFEGNGGDLRIGLPMQSLHDGERWMHTPLRLTVLVEAPRSAIETILGRHEVVRQLVENEWLYLMRMDGNVVERYRAGRWVAQSHDASRARERGAS